MSANIKASVDGTQAIIGVGGVDQMTVNNAGVVTANSFVGNVTGNVTGAGTFSGNASSATALATGSTTARTLANRFSDVVNVLDFGADPTGSVDSTQAIQDALNYVDDNGVILINGTFLISSPIVCSKFGVTFQGSGVSHSEIVASHTIGPVLQLRKSYSSILNISINATDARKNSSYNPLNAGIIIGDFDWSNPSSGFGPSGIFCKIEQCRILSQPGTGILIEAGGAFVKQTLSSENKGHGIYIDDGNIIGLQPSNIGFPGWTEISQCRSNINGGHGICVGNSTPNPSQPPYRIKISNNDISQNSTNASVRNTLDQIYIVAEQVFSDLNGVAGSMYVAGRNHAHINNRFILTSNIPVYSIGQITGFSTDGISIQDFRVNGNPVDPAISIDPSLNNESGIRIRCDFSANITNIVQSSDIDKITEIIYDDKSFTRGGIKTWGTPEIPVNSVSTLGTGLNIDNNGKIVIKNTASTSTAFEHNKVGWTSGTQVYSTFRINGNIIGQILTTDGATTNYNTGSDYRLKENIIEIKDGLEKLSKIPVYEFNFKVNPTKKVTGFLAHELMEHIPEAVSGNKDDVDVNGNPIYQGVDQSKLTPLLVAAVKELSERVKTLESK